MEVEKTLKPGENGTKRFVERFGDKLVCVRHRHDRNRGMRYTTVELIIDQRLSKLHYGPGPRDQGRELKPVRIAYAEEALRQKVREAGGYWDTEKRVWWLPADIVHRLNLKDRLA